jgi:hypothetical protein
VVEWIGCCCCGRLFGGGIGGVTWWERRAVRSGFGLREEVYMEKVPLGKKGI